MPNTFARSVRGSDGDGYSEEMLLFFLIKTRHCGPSLAVATMAIIIILICYSRVPIDLVIGQMTAKDILFRFLRETY